MSILLKNEHSMNAKMNTFQTKDVATAPTDMVKSSGRHPILFIKERFVMLEKLLMSFSLHNDQGILLNGVVTFFTSAAIAAYGPPLTVYDSSWLIAWCVIGSCAGSAFGLAVTPPPPGIDDSEKRRRILFEFAVTSVNSFTITPGIILHWGTIVKFEKFQMFDGLNLGLDPASVALTSTIISALLTIAIHFGFAIVAFAKKRMWRFLGVLTQKTEDEK